MEVAYAESEEDVTGFTRAIWSEGDHVEREASKEPGKEGKATLPHVL